MRACFVFEKFKEDSDPIKDMGIGYSKRTLNCVSYKILQFIKSKGEEGASFTEIQYHIWTNINGNDPKEFFEKSEYSHDPLFSQRKTRGYWCTNLLGFVWSHQGLLHKFCKKNKNNKWILVRMPLPNENMYDWRKR